MSDAHAVLLDHQVYNEFCKAWEKRASGPQPFIDVTIQAVLSDAHSLGFHAPLKTPTHPVTYLVMADTGCQSCLAGTALLTKLGLDRRHLLPVNMKMTAANRGATDIIGALALRNSGTSPSKTMLETHQMIYFTSSTDRMFLSKQTCIALGIIPPSFPTIGGTDTSNTTKDAVPSTSQTQNCECPRRQCPPPPPTSLPIPATEENRERLEKWLLDYYSSISFNVCQHQPLPKMSAPPPPPQFASWSTPTPARSPTTPPSQSPSTGRRPSRPALTRAYAWVSLSRSPSALLSLGATKWTSAPKSLVSAGVQKTYMPLIDMPHGRHTTRSHPSTKLARCHLTQGNRCLTLGTDITASHLTTGTST